MTQTSAIVATLVIAFLVFITLRGELKQWVSIFGI